MNDISEEKICESTFFCQNFSEEHNDFLKPDNLRQDIVRNMKCIQK